MERSPVRVCELARTDQILTLWGQAYFKRIILRVSVYGFFEPFLGSTRKR